MLCAQSTSVIDPKTDSVIRAEFQANAKKIYADLIEGDFARKENVQLKAQLSTAQDLQIGTKAFLEQCQESQNVLQKKAAADARAKAMAKLENWGWRVLALLALYVTVK